MLVKRNDFNSKIRTIQWEASENNPLSGCSRMVDQTLFPQRFEYVEIKTVEQMYDAILTMIVRGAPAIGMAGAQDRKSVV